MVHLYNMIIGYIVHAFITNMPSSPTTVADFQCLTELTKQKCMPFWAKQCIDLEFLHQISIGLFTIIKKICSKFSWETITSFFTLVECNFKRCIMLDRFTERSHFDQDVEVIDSTRMFHFHCRLFVLFCFVFNVIGNSPKMTLAMRWSVH